MPAPLEPSPSLPLILEVKMSWPSFYKSSLSVLQCQRAICYYYTTRVPTSLVTQNSMYFPGKCNEIPGQFGFESVFVLIMQIWQRHKSDFFWKWLLEKWILNNKIYKVQVFFSRFWIKIPGFSKFWRKFQAFSRPGKVNDKIQGFQGFPGSVGTLTTILSPSTGSSILIKVVERCHIYSVYITWSLKLTFIIPWPAHVKCWQNGSSQHVILLD